MLFKVYTAAKICTDTKIMFQQTFSLKLIGK